MTWQESINIAGVTSSGLVAAGAGDDTYGTINIYSAGGEPGILNNGSAVTGGTINVSGGGTANSAVTASDGILTVRGGGVVNSTTVAAN